MARCSSFLAVLAFSTLLGASALKLSDANTTEDRLTPEQAQNFKDAIAKWRQDSQKLAAAEPLGLVAQGLNNASSDESGPLGGPSIRKYTRGQQMIPNGCVCNSPIFDATDPKLKQKFECTNFQDYRYYCDFSGRGGPRPDPDAMFFHTFFQMTCGGYIEFNEHGVIRCGKGRTYVGQVNAICAETGIRPRWIWKDAYDGFPDTIFVVIEDCSAQSSDRHCMRSQYAALHPLGDKGDCGTRLDRMAGFSFQHIFLPLAGWQQSEIKCMHVERPHPRWGEGTQHDASDPFHQKER